MAWSSSIAASLNGLLLPEQHFAELRICIGGRLEENCGTEPAFVARRESTQQAATVLQAWDPPRPVFAMPGVFPDEIEVQIRDGGNSGDVVGVVSFVTVGNKDRPETRRAFASKCAAYLQQGIGLVVIDVVTERHANMHDKLITLLQQSEQFRFAPDSLLYTVAYRPARWKEGDQIDIWPAPLAVDQPLPIMPLALRGGPTLPLDLEITYTEARQGSRL
jgi:hypothetical protein